MTTGMNSGTTESVESTLPSRPGENLRYNPMPTASSTTTDVLITVTTTVTNRSPRNREFVNISPYADNVGTTPCAEWTFWPISATVRFRPPVKPRLKPNASTTGNPMNAV